MTLLPAGGVDRTPPLVRRHRDVTAPQEEPMARTITVEDLRPEGMELTDEELAGIAGGMRDRDTLSSSKCIDMETGSTDRDPDF
jgi:putative ATP-grasp target RiPP